MGKVCNTGDAANVAMSFLSFPLNAALRATSRRNKHLPVGQFPPLIPKM